MTYPSRDRTDHPEIQAPPTERLVPEDERVLPTAKKRGRAAFYTEYKLQVCEVKREHAFTASSKAAQEA